MLGSRNDVTGFVERPVRDGVAIPGALIVYLHRGRPLQCGTILSQCRCLAVPNTDDRDRFEVIVNYNDGFGWLFFFTACPRTHSDSTSDSSWCPASFLFHAYHSVICTGSTPDSSTL